MRQTKSNQQFYDRKRKSPERLIAQYPNHIKTQYKMVASLGFVDEDDKENNSASAWTAEQL